jgi:heterotetrameric sarcosine oxidase gamma subunit
MPERRKFSVRTKEPLAPPLRAAKLGPDGTALWLGPDEYFVLGDEAPAADSVIDFTGRTVGLCVDGPRAAWCVNAFCPLDLDTIPVDGCTRTVFGKAEIILWRRGGESFHIEVARSFAPYVWACLEEARREFFPAPAAC